MRAKAADMKLSEEQARELRLSGADPVRITDPETAQEYVVVRAEVYERLQEPSDDMPDLRETALQIQRNMAEDDADDPLLESYQDRLEQP
jgi:hypothetical protein